MRARLIGSWLLGAACLVALSACSEKVESVAPGASTLPTPSSSVAGTSPPSTSVPPSTSTPSTPPPTSTVPPTTTLPPDPTTSCEQVVHIGDSTAVPLFDPNGVGGANFTMTAQLQAIGVEVVYPDNADRRAIIERPDGLQNAIDVAQGVAGNGFDGCWVLMIGTNDAAAIAGGAPETAQQRIRDLMFVIGDARVLWVDTVSQRTDDDYRNASMLAWNETLYSVIAEYPNARVFRWYDVVLPVWFRDDGLHYTVEGSAQRAALTAQALLDAFPAPIG